jgi:hypothetical protein
VLDAIMPLPEEMRFMADTRLQVAVMAMNTLVLGEPLSYYRRHTQDLYRVEGNDDARLRRKYEMTELVHERTFAMLLRLGVPRESASALLEGTWLDARRWRLSHFGGSRLEALQTEMQAFRAAMQNPSLLYRGFKYLLVGAATLLFRRVRFIARGSGMRGGSWGVRGIS